MRRVMKQRTVRIIGASILIFLLVLVIGIIIYGAFSPYVALQGLALVLLTILIAIIVNLLIAVAILLLNGWH